ncbi:PEP/pyruvate-binding domain-containing protein [Streptomyces sp. NPDC000410]|uniref:PEP/pyruvate-binding domain-containing protein n=1 Tax=Streptomyces sp. NPDC000410 TaxID=3154254 RepID=UPI0033333324
MILPGRDHISCQTGHTGAYTNFRTVPPALGRFESVTVVTDLPKLAVAIRRAWATTFSPRAVRLRHRGGWSLEDSGMGVTVQRLQPCDLGGEMVTWDPSRPENFRSVVIDCSSGSMDGVVVWRTPTHRFLYNTVEGGGRVVAKSNGVSDLDLAAMEGLSRLALAGRLLQGHFGGSAERSAPLDVEWLLDPDGRLCLVQIRPYLL